MDPLQRKQRCSRHRFIRRCDSAEAPGRQRRAAQRDGHPPCRPGRKSAPSAHRRPLQPRAASAAQRADPCPQSPAECSRRRRVSERCWRHSDDSAVKRNSPADREKKQRLGRASLSSMSRSLRRFLACLDLLFLCGNTSEDISRRWDVARHRPNPRSVSQIRTCRGNTPVASSCRSLLPHRGLG